MPPGRLLDARWGLLGASLGPRWGHCAPFETLSLESASLFSQWPTREAFPPKRGAIEDEVGG
eukprot:8755755-Pyramimonas_sp.AAC.1